MIQAMEGQGAEALLATIERRVTYLEWRAKGLEIEVRSKPRKTEPPLQLAMLGASLWLDAAESAASIGAWVRSRTF
ncbi:MAG TPA: hypothetical protein VFQ20_11795, partial [Burkholderiaceae bacterium]|nr:hypothetical protein [Burkholderiaceae bacterium]